MGTDVAATYYRSLVTTVPAASDVNSGRILHQNAILAISQPARTSHSVCPKRGSTRVGSNAKCATGTGELSCAKELLQVVDLLNGANQGQILWLLVSLRTMLHHAPGKLIPLRSYLQRGKGGSSRTLEVSRSGALHLARVDTGNASPAWRPAIALSGQRGVPPDVSDRPGGDDRLRQATLAQLFRSATRAVNSRPTTGPGRALDQASIL